MDDGKHTLLASVEDALRNAAGHSLPTASFESLVVGGGTRAGKQQSKHHWTFFFSLLPVVFTPGVVACPEAPPKSEMVSGIFHLITRCLPALHTYVE